MIGNIKIIHKIYTTYSVKVCPCKNFNFKLNHFVLGCVDEHAVETVVFIEIINQNPLITAQLSQLKTFVPKYENIQQTQSTENNWSQPDTTKRNLKKFREKTLSSSPAQSTHFSSLFAGLWSFLICYILPLFKSCVGRFLLAHYKNVLHVPWYKISLNSIDYPVPPERRRMLRWSSSEIRVTSLIGCAFSVQYFWGRMSEASQSVQELCIQRNMSVFYFFGIWLIWSIKISNRHQTLLFVTFSD